MRTRLCVRVCVRVRVGSLVALCGSLWVGGVSGSGSGCLAVWVALVGSGGGSGSGSLVGAVWVGSGWLSLGGSAGLAKVHLLTQAGLLLARSPLAQHSSHTSPLASLGIKKTH